MQSPRGDFGMKLTISRCSSLDGVTSDAGFDGMSCQRSVARARLARPEAHACLELSSTRTPISIEGPPMAYVDAWRPGEGVVVRTNSAAPS